jgi:hypothetical protein
MSLRLGSLRAEIRILTPYEKEIIWRLAPKEKKSIKSGLFIEIYKLQRPRGRYFFLTPAQIYAIFSHMILKFGCSFSPKFQSQNSTPSDIVWDFLRHVLTTA